MALCLLAAVAGCEDGSPSVFIEVDVVDGQGGNPAEGTPINELLITLEQEGLFTEDFAFPVIDGQFDAGVQFVSFAATTRMRVELRQAGAGGVGLRLLSAPPPFSAAESLGFVRLVAARSTSCERVTFVRLETPRAFFAMLPSGTFATSFGGSSSTLPTDQVELLDMLQWKKGLVSDVAFSPLGPTRAALIDETKALVVPNDASAFIFDLNKPGDGAIPVTLHPGSGPASALLSVPGRGAMVVGGEIDGTAVAQVSLVSSDGTVSALSLDAPRAGPVATALGQNVLVVGGDSLGSAELLEDGQTTGIPVTSLTDGVRQDALLVGDTQSMALLLGGTDANGALRRDTVVFNGCSDDSGCQSASGPSWATARSGVLNPAGSTLLVGGEDSTLVEEVFWSRGTALIGPFSNLSFPRAGAAGVVLESGALIVAGGDDGVGSRSDFEFCVPSELTRL